MYRLARFSVLTAVFAISLPWAPTFAQEGIPVPKRSAPVDPDEKLLQDTKVGTDAASLIAFLQKRSASDADLQGLDGLIRQLGDQNFGVRQQASRKLVGLGLAALPALRQAQADGDPERKRRVRSCIAQIAKDSELALPLAAVRLLVRQRAAGAAEALLRYLPFAGDEEVEEEIYYALDSLAVHQGKPEAPLVTALTDALPARRAVAACLVGWHGDAQQRAAVSKLLDDADSMVRLRAAQGLLAAHDKRAIPALVGLLDEPSVAVSWQAEELLHYVAGDESPGESIGAATDAARNKCRTAWETWLRVHGPKVNLAALDQTPRRPGLLLVCEKYAWDNAMDSYWEVPAYGATCFGLAAAGGLAPWLELGAVHRKRERIWLCGCDGKPRWGLTNLNGPWQAQLLADNDLLVGEETRVSERDLEGNVLWERPIRKGTIHPTCQRLRNGNIFLYTEDGMLEITVTGEEKKCAEPDPGPYRPLSAQKLDNGLLLCNDLFSSEDLAVLDPATGRFTDFFTLTDLRSLSDRTYRAAYGSAIGFAALGAQPFSAAGIVAFVALTPVHMNLGNAERMLVLPGGRFLTDTPERLKLLETDAAGHTLWTCRIRVAASLFLPRYPPTSVYPAARLRNGNTLAVDFHRVPELDQTGRPVWEAHAEGPIASVRASLDLVRLGFGGQRPASVNCDSRANRVKELRSPNQWVRLYAMLAMPDVELAMADFEALLYHPDHQVRRFAVTILSSLGPRAVPAFIRALHATERDIKLRAIDILWEMGIDANPALPALIEVISDHDVEVRTKAISAVGHLSRGTVSGVPALVAILRDSKEHLGARREAAFALGSIGSPAETAVPLLLHSLQSQDLDLRCAAALALGAINRRHKEVLPALIACLNDPASPRMRAVGANSLGEMGPDAKLAVPALIDALRMQEVTDRESMRSIRWSVLGALRSIGSGAAAAVPLLIEILQDKKFDQNERWAAMDALRQIGPAAKAAIPALNAALADKDPRIRSSAADALKAIRALRTPESQSSRK
jgi:HEAT repeat protein